MNVNFFRAADAFLYLPTYIAQHHGIYKDIDQSFKVSFYTPGGVDSGDQAALESMIADSKDGNSLPFAICDPFIMFRNSEVQPKDLRVLGAMIVKVPFWAIDSGDGEFEENHMRGKFDRIAYYNELLITGNYIGKRTAALAGIHNILPITFGKEFECLSPEPEERTLAVTCDVVGMALLNKQITINHRYSNNSHYRDFVTTALVTTSAIYDDHRHQIVEVLEGVQRSLAILRSSKNIAFSVCKELAKRSEFYLPHHRDIKRADLDDSEIDWIVNLIYQGEFYPNSLEISRMQWERTLDSHMISDHFRKDAFQAGKALYDTIVDHKYLELARRSTIWSLVGIDPSELVSEQTSIGLVFSDYRKISKLLFSIAALAGLVLCFFPSLNSLPARVIVLAVGSLAPLRWCAVQLGKRIGLLKRINRSALLWPAFFVFTALSMFLFYLAYNLTPGDPKSTMFYTFCGIAASGAVTALFTRLSK